MTTPLFSDIRDRVEKAINSKIELIPEHPCWEWIGAKYTRGYGYFRLNGKQVKASRASYEFYKGPIPKGMMICHTCDNKGCVNPLHLYAGTAQDNANDKYKRNRFNLKPFCPKGHKKDRLNHHGHGECSICQKAAGRKHYYKKQAERQSGKIVYKNS